MQLRLQRLLADRTLMLGAISHDPRTLLTRLRLGGARCRLPRQFL
jgi:hypothetical protein